MSVLMMDLTEVEVAPREPYTFDHYDNFYAAIAVMRGALPQTLQNIVENPAGCEMSTRVIDRLRDAAMDQIPYGVVSRNRTWDGRRA